MRDAFPDAPIFVRSDRKEAVKKLIQAGATEVVVATGSVASGMGNLLGVRKDTRFGGLVDDSAAAMSLSNLAFPLYPSVSSDDTEPDLSGLAETLTLDDDMDPNTTRKLFKLFSTSLTLNDDGKVQLGELVNEILRTSDIFVDDDTLRQLLGCDSLNDKCLVEAQVRYVSFSEFVTLYRQNRAMGKK